MKPLLGVTLMMASIGWATPLAITGDGYTNIGIHVNGPDGFTFNSTGGSGAWVPYGPVCVPGRACDLSGGVGNYGPLDGGYFVSDGSTSVGVNAGPVGTPPGFVAFDVRWTATPFDLAALPGVPPANHIGLNVPITLFGTLEAWTGQEFASNSAPFFNYSFRGRGTLAVAADILYDYSRPPHNPVLVSANFTGAGVTFTGTAEPVPEPASWLLALPILAVVLFRGARRAKPPAPSKI